MEDKPAKGSEQNRKYSDKEVQSFVKLLKDTYLNLWNELRACEEQKQESSAVYNKMINIAYENGYAERMSQFSMLYIKLRKFARIELNLPL